MWKYIPNVFRRQLSYVISRIVDFRSVIDITLDIYPPMPGSTRKLRNGTFGKKCEDKTSQKIWKYISKSPFPKTYVISRFVDFRSLLVIDITMDVYFLMSGLTCKLRNGTFGTFPKL